MVVRAIEILFSPIEIFIDFCLYIMMKEFKAERVRIPNDINGLQKRLDNSLSSWDYEANLDGLSLTERDFT